MQAKKTRHQFLLDPALSEKLERLCRHPGAKKSDLVARAVTAFLDRRGESEIDQRYSKRLDRLSRDIAHVRRDVETALESLALLIRFVITLNAHTPAPDKATQAVAHERFLKFIDQVGRQIAGGKSSFGIKDESEEVQP
jgi:cell division FtsZ-interacting protein ZapD